MKSKGFGDSIEKFTEKTGIKSVVKKIFGEDCGCDERKEKLNKLLPYKTQECINAEEFEWCDTYFQKYTTNITKEAQKKMIDIHNRIYKRNKKQSSCGSCVRGLYSEIEQLYKAYRDEIQK